MKLTRTPLALFLLGAALLAPALSVRAADWPEFRGPQGDGHVAPGSDKKPLGLPLTWSETANVKWKTAIPLRGWSTPVAMDGKIWLTTADPQGHDFYAIGVDAETGKILHNVPLFHSDTPEPLGNPINCYASPSPAIEHGRVYVHFGSYGTACLDSATGQPVWKRNDLPCRHYRGPGSSLVLFEDLLILTMDGVDVQYLAALDKTTGKTVWRTDRTTVWNDLDSSGKPISEGDMRKAFCTPFIVRAGGQLQMFSPGAKAAYAYDPRTGRELWHVTYKGYSNVSRPLYGFGLAFIHAGFGVQELWAIRPDGKGDVTASNIVWKAKLGLSRTPSPVLVDDLLYSISEDGALSCLEARTGKEVWKQRIGGTFVTSPIYGDGRLYLASQQGRTIVIKPGRACQILAKNELADGFMASPAVCGKSLILRGKQFLYRIDDAGEGSAPAGTPPEKK